MYKKEIPSVTNISRNTSYTAEPIENKILRIMNNKEPISDGAPLIYSERKDGVIPEYNMKTDRWEIAIDAMDKVNKNKLAKRESKLTLGEQAKEGMKKEVGKTESVQATDPK